MVSLRYTTGYTGLHAILQTLGQARLMRQVAAVRDTAQAQLREQGDTWTHAGFEAERVRIENLLAAGDFRAAHSAAQALLAKPEAAGADAYPDDAYDLAMANFLLGRILNSGGAPAQALPHLQAAQRQFQAVGPRAGRMASACHIEIGGFFWRSVARLCGNGELLALWRAEARPHRHKLKHVPQSGRQSPKRISSLRNASHSSKPCNDSRVRPPAWTLAMSLVFRPRTGMNPAMKKRALLWMSIALLLCIGVGCGKKDADGTAQQKRPEALEPLKVGMDLTYPPFETVNGDGDPEGVSVDMAMALGKHLGRPVEIRSIAFNGLIAALKTGSIDCVLSSMTANEERRKSIDFSDPYVRTGLAILAGKDAGIKGIDDVKAEGRRIAVQIGTTGAMWAEANLKEENIVVLDKTPACVMEVVNKKADAFLFDQLSVFKFAERNAETTVGLLKPFQEEEWAFGIRKGDDEMREEINEFLAAYRKAGEFTKLAEKWLGDEKAMLDGMGIPFLFVED